MTLLPTRRRPALLEKFLISAQQAETLSAGMIMIDETDWHLYKEIYEPMFEKLMPPLWECIVTKTESMADKITEVWPIVKKRNAQWVNILNDDHIIITKHWDTRLVKKLNGRNFVTCNDRWMAPQKAAGATIWSMPLLEAVGFRLYPPGLQHLFIDDLWENIGRHSGCWDIDMSVVIEHRHAIKFESDKDETYMKVYNKEAWDKDNNVYQEFIKTDFKDTIKKVIALETADLPKEWKEWKDGLITH